MRLEGAMGAAVLRSAGLVDRVPAFDAAKVGVLLVRRGQSAISEALANPAPGPPAFERFVSRLAPLVPTRGHPGFLGGLDRHDAQDGAYARVWSPLGGGLRLVFHVATDMAPPPPPGPSDAPAAGPSPASGGPADTNGAGQGGSPFGPPAAALPAVPPSPDGAALVLNRKRHIGNDAVVVVWAEDGMGGLGPGDLGSQVTRVVVLVQPAGPSLVRVSVLCTDELLPFGPLGPLLGAGSVAEAFVREARDPAQARCLDELEAPSPGSAASVAGAMGGAASARKDSPSSTGRDRAASPRLTVPALVALGRWPGASSAVVAEWAAARLVRCVVLAADQAVRATHAAAGARKQSSGGGAGVEPLCFAAERRRQLLRVASRLRKAGARGSGVTQ